MRRASLLRRHLRAATAAALTGSCLILVARPASAGVADEPDVTPPVISITGIAAGSLAPLSLQFTPTVTDNVQVQRIETLVNGVPDGTCRLITSGAWNCTVLLTEKYAANDTDAQITLRAVDPAGNQSESSTQVHVDNVRPTATISPVHAYTHSGTLPITFTDVSDDLASIYDGSTVLTAAPWAFTWQATNGAGSPCFLLKDKAGNRTEMCSGYVVDDDPPVIRDVTYETAYNTGSLAHSDGWVGGWGHVWAHYDDQTPVSFEWLLNGVRQSTEYDFYLDARAIKTVTAVLELRLRDAVGNVTSASYTVNVDNRGPAFASILPAHHALVRGTYFTTSIKVSDPSGVAYTNLEGGDGLNSPPDVHASGRVESGKDGVRRVTWRAVDKLGNETYASRDVVVDNTLPGLRITKAPKNNAKLTKPVTIVATASDRNGVGRVQLLVNGKVIATDTKAAYRFALDPKKFGKAFVVQLRAYDRAGNVRSTGKLHYRR